MMREKITGLIRSASIEITPKMLIKMGRMPDFLPQGMKVSVTYLAGSTFLDTVDCAIRLKVQGFRPIVHLAACHLKSSDELIEGLDLLQEHQIRDLLILGGSSFSMHKVFKDSLALLSSGIIERYQWDSIGFAGYPEGNPTISKEKLWQALFYKQSYAKTFPCDYYLVSQFCFIADHFLKWQEDMLSYGIDFPLRFGIAGVTNISSLIKYAHICGVNASFSFLRANRMFAFRLLGMSSPAALVYDLAKYHCAHEDVNYQLHFFPLGGFDTTTLWMNAILQGKFNVDETRLTVNL